MYWEIPTLGLFEEYDFKLKFIPTLIDNNHCYLSRPVGFFWKESYCYILEVHSTFISSWYT